MRSPRSFQAGCDPCRDPFRTNCDHSDLDWDRNDHNRIALKLSRLAPIFVVIGPELVVIDLGLVVIGAELVVIGPELVGTGAELVGIGPELIVNASGPSRSEPIFVVIVPPPIVIASESIVITRHSFFNK
jgi:hypothetical protein